MPRDHINLPSVELLRRILPTLPLVWLQGESEGFSGREGHVYNGPMGVFA